MGLYFSKSLGGGFRVTIPVGGRRRRKNEPGLLLSLCYLFLFFMLIAFVVAYWPIALGLFSAYCVACVVWYIAKNKQTKQAELKSKLLPLTEKLQRHCKLATEAKTLPTRLNNCTQAITVLEEIKTLDPCDSVVADTDPLLAKLHSLLKVLPVIDMCDKGDRAQFKGQKKKALDAYLDALYQCQTEHIADGDFEAADVRDGPNHERVSLDQIQQRVRRLGGNGDRTIA